MISYDLGKYMAPNPIKHHQRLFEEESSLLRLATDNIYTPKSHV